MYNVSFLGLKENIAYGHQAIAGVKKDFPYGFKSNTYYQTFEQPVNEDTLHYYEDLIETTRALILYKKRLGIPRKEATKEVVSVTNSANCGEQALLVSQKLDELGVKNKIITMNLCTKKINSQYITNGHSFCVIDTAPDMKVSDPDTWGEDAVIVDMWSNTVAKVQDAIKFFGSFLQPKKDEVVQFTVEDCY